MRGLPAEGNWRNLRAHGAGAACLRRFECGVAEWNGAEGRPVLQPMCRWKLLPATHRRSRVGGASCVLLLRCRLGLQCSELSHQAGGFLRRVSFAGSAEPKELNHIQTSFAQFQTANQAAFTVEFCGQLPLRQSSFGAQSHQHFTNTLALAGINRFVHARMLRAIFACFQNASRQDWGRQLDLRMANRTLWNF